MDSLQEVSDNRLDMRCNILPVCIFIIAIIKLAQSNFGTEVTNSGKIQRKSKKREIIQPPRGDKDGDLVDFSSQPRAADVEVGVFVGVKVSTAQADDDAPEIRQMLSDGVDQQRHFRQCDVRLFAGSEVTDSGRFAVIKADAPQVGAMIHGEIGELLHGKWLHHRGFKLDNIASFFSIDPFAPGSVL